MARALALVDHRLRENRAGQLGEYDEAVRRAENGGHGNTCLEQAVVEVDDARGRVRLEHLEEHVAVGEGGLEHGAAAGAVAHNLNRHGGALRIARGNTEPSEGFVENIRVAHLREHRQPRVVGVAPHPHVHVAVGHHEGLLGGEHVLFLLTDVGAHAEELIARFSLGAVKLHPAHLSAEHCFRGARRAVVDVVERPFDELAARVGDGRLEHTSGLGPREKLGTVKGLCHAPIVAGCGRALLNSRVRRVYGTDTL